MRRFGMYAVLLRVMAVLTVAPALSDTAALTSVSGRLGLYVVVAYLLSWAYCALVRAEAGRGRSPVAWLLPQLTLAQAALVRARHTPAARMARLALWPLGLIAVSAAMVGALAWLGMTALIVLWVVTTPVVAFSLYQITRDLVLPTLHDLRWYLRWRARRIAGITAQDLLDCIGEQRTSRGACRVVADIRREQLLERSATTSAVLLDLNVVGGAFIDEHSPTGTPLRTEIVARWVRAVEGDLPRRMVRFGSPFLDELSRLLEAYAPPRR